MDAYEKFVAKMLQSRHAEALEWLRGGSPQSFRNIGELDTTEESISYVQRLYDAGAVKAIAAEIDQYEMGENTGHLLVQLPSGADCSHWSASRLTRLASTARKTPGKNTFISSSIDRRLMIREHTSAPSA